MRTNCYWYYEVQDMGANIPFCKLKKGLDPLNNASCLECQHYHSKYKPTNADRIRAMSDEEFSHFLFGIQCAPASRPKEWLDWLKQEAT